MANRQPWFSQARETLAVAARLWPGWLAAAVAISVFLTLRHHASTQRAANQRLQAVTQEIRWVERAVATAAITHHLPPGAVIPSATWQKYIDPAAPPHLKTDGRDTFGYSFGPQQADHSIAVPAPTRLLLTPSHR